MSPKVSPPSPHSSPKNHDQNSARPGACASTPGRSCVSASPKIHGATIQLKNPPTSHDVSHDQRFTPRNAT